MAGSGSWVRQNSADRLDNRAHGGGEASINPTAGGAADGPQKNDSDKNVALMRQAPKRPPGCVWKHPKTGGFYWKVRSDFVPAKLRGRGRYTNLPLRPIGLDKATKTKAMAENVRARLWRQWLENDGQEPVAATLEHLLTEFKAWHASRGTKEPQTHRTVWIVRQFLTHANASSVDGFTLAALHAYLADVAGRRSKRTVQAHRNALHLFCRFLELRQAIEHNPVRLVEVARPDRRPPRYLTDPQISALLQHARRSGPPWLATAICVGLYAGLRVSEIRQLRWQDVDGEMLVVGGAAATKTGDWRTVPIPRPLAAALGRWRRRCGKGSRVGSGSVFPHAHSKSYWSAQMSKLTEPLPVFGELAGHRTGNQWHLLRSTFAVQAARGRFTRSGLPANMWELMAWLGHSNPATTMKYVNIAQAAGSFTRRPAKSRRKGTAKQKQQSTVKRPGR